MNHEGKGKGFWGLIMKHGKVFQCFTLYWQEEINKAKLFICFKKLISVLNVGLQTTQINTKNHFPSPCLGLIHALIAKYNCVPWNSDILQGCRFRPYMMQILKNHYENVRTCYST